MYMSTKHLTAGRYAPRRTENTAAQPLGAQSQAVGTVGPIAQYSRSIARSGAAIGPNRPPTEGLTDGHDRCALARFFNFL